MFHNRWCSQKWSIVSKIRIGLTDRVKATTKTQPCSVMNLIKIPFVSIHYHQLRSKNTLNNYRKMVSVISTLKIFEMQMVKNDCDGLLLAKSYCNQAIIVSKKVLTLWLTVKKTCNKINQVSIALVNGLKGLLIIKLMSLWSWHVKIRRRRSVSQLRCTLKDIALFLFLVQNESSSHKCLWHCNYIINN